MSIRFTVNSGYMKDIQQGKVYEGVQHNGLIYFLDDVGCSRFRCSDGVTIIGGQSSDAASDAVNSPSHYNQGKVECVDAIEASLSVEAFRGFLKGNAIKYLWRYESKGKRAEDLDKANWYLDRLRKSEKEAI